MTEQISSSLRRQVEERAGSSCEYCRMPQSFAFHRHEPDHIVPRQHGGMTEAENLALACLRCNRSKGPNVGSFDPTTGRLVRFFNPRSDEWREHFGWDGAKIVPRTAEARVTLKILKINEPSRLAERARLIDLGVL